MWAVFMPVNNLQCCLHWCITSVPSISTLAIEMYRVIYGILYSTFVVLLASEIQSGNRLEIAFEALSNKLAQDEVRTPR